MRPAEVIDVDVVPQARAVRGGVVHAEELKVGPFADSRVYSDRDQMGLGIMVLSDCSVFGGARRIEIPEGREAQPMGPGQRLEGVFDVQFGLAVGIYGRLGKRFHDRQAGGFAVGGAGGGEDELRDVRLGHRAQEVQGRDNVVKVVLQRVGHRFADVAVGRKMHHDLYPLIPEDPPDGGSIAQINLVEGDVLGDGGSMPVNQIVQDHGPMARGRQLADAMAADVTGSSCD